MTFLTRSAPSKTWSAPNKPSGFYVAEVTRVENGNEVYVQVPRLTYEFEHGPIVYSGTALSVGDKTWIGFLEGRQDDVVAPFPGGGGPLLIPDTIEVTLLIASTTSSAGMQGRANFLCNGTNDEVQFLAAANAVQSSASKVGRVVVAEGSYTFEDRLFKAGGGSRFDVSFVGMGVDATVITGDHVGEFDNGVIEWFENGSLEFRNLRFDASEFGGGDLAPYLIYKDGDGTGSLILDNVEMNSDQGSLVWTDDAFYSRRFKGYSQNGSGLTTRNKVWLEGADIEANGPCLDFNTNIVSESAVRVTRSRFLATQTTAILGNNLSVSSTTIDSNVIETTSPSPCIDLKTGWVLNNRLVAANSTTGALHFASTTGSSVIWVTGNDIDNGTQPGIKFLDGRYSIIDDNFLRAWGGVGIDIDRVIVSDSESFIVTDNKFANVAAGTGPGIRINDTSFAVVADNQFYSFDDTAVRVQGGSETALISRNLIVGSVPNGIDKIHIDQSDDVVVDRNHIVEGGIHIEDSNYAQVTNNVQEGAHGFAEVINWTHAQNTNTISVPTGGQDGDFLILTTSRNNSPEIFASGFSALTRDYFFRTPTGDGASTAGFSLEVPTWSALPSSYTYTGGGSLLDHLVLIIVRNLESGNPFGVAGATFHFNIGDGPVSYDSPSIASDVGEFLIHWTFFEQSVTLTAVDTVGFQRIFNPGPSAPSVPNNASSEVMWFGYAPPGTETGTFEWERTGIGGNPDGYALSVVYNLNAPTESYNIKLSGTTERATVQRNVYQGSRLVGAATIEGGVLVDTGVTETKIRDNELSYAQFRVTDNGSSTLDVGLIPVRIEDRSATLTTGSGAQPVPWIGTAEIESVRATVGTSPTGSDEVIVDVNVNGSTLWTAQGNQPSVAPAGTGSGLVFPDQNAILSDGDIITVDIDQVGDTTAGGYLTVTIYIREI